jgi:ADP-ribose pyrophosphatase YjhB (NUDIX family)
MSEPGEGERVPFFGEITEHQRPLAMFGVIIENSAFLLVRREGEELWEPPTSVLRPDEDFAECAARAVLEQTDVKVDAKLAAYITGVYENGGHPQRPVTIGWRFVIHSGQPTPGDGIAEVEWIPRKGAFRRTSELAMSGLRGACNMCVWHHTHDGSQRDRKPLAPEPQRHLRVVEDR